MPMRKQGHGHFRLCAAAFLESEAVGRGFAECGLQAGYHLHKNQPAACAQSGLAARELVEGPREHSMNHGRHLMTEIMAHRRPEEAQRIVGKKRPSSSALAFMGGVVLPPSASTMVFAKAKDVPMPTDPGSRTWRAASYLTCCWPLEAMTWTSCPCHGHSDLTIMFRRPVHASPLLPGPASSLVK